MHISQRPENTWTFFFVFFFGIWETLEFNENPRESHGIYFECNF